jgi:hypothetical protein
MSDFWFGLGYSDGAAFEGSCLGLPTQQPAICRGWRLANDVFVEAPEQISAFHQSSFLLGPR